jgi:hypothetical protein
MPDEKGWSSFLAKYNVSPGMLKEPDIVKIHWFRKILKKITLQIQELNTIKRV